MQLFYSLSLEHCVASCRGGESDETTPWTIHIIIASMYYITACTKRRVVQYREIFPPPIKIFSNEDERPSKGFKILYNASIIPKCFCIPKIMLT